MILDIVVLACVVVVQQCLIFGLINRVLMAKGVSPLKVPSPLWHDKVEEPKPEGKRVKPVMTIPLQY